MNLPTVTLTQPTSGALENVVEGTGYVTYSNTWNIYGENNGRVRKILVSSGDKVEKNQTFMIVQMDSNQSEIEVKAPKAGIILTVGVQKDMYVMAVQNTVLVQMAEESTAWIVDLEVDTETASMIDKNSQVSLKIGDVSEKKEGKIVDIKSFIKDDGKEGYTVSISLECSDDTIAGKKVEIIIRKTSKEYETILPNYTLNKDAQGYYVLVLTEKESILGNNYVVTRVSVDLLDTDNSNVAVMGINSNMSVIASSTSEIQEGDRVKYDESGE